MKLCICYHAKVVPKLKTSLQPDAGNDDTIRKRTFETNFREIILVALFCRFFRILS